MTMKLKYEFSVRNVVGEHILVPLGEGALAFSGIITTNEVGAFLMELLGQEIGYDTLLSRVLENYEVDEATARADLDEFLDYLGQLSLLE
jgi:hypothetical protein